MSERIRLLQSLLNRPDFDRERFYRGLHAEPPAGEPAMPPASDYDAMRQMHELQQFYARHGMRGLYHRDQDGGDHVGKKPHVMPTLILRKLQSEGDPYIPETPADR